MKQHNWKLYAIGAIIIAVVAILATGTMFSAYKHSEEKNVSLAARNDMLHVQNVEQQATLDKYRSMGLSETVDITLSEPIKLGDQVCIRKARIKTTKNADVTEQVKEALRSVQGLELASAGTTIANSSYKETTKRNGVLYFGVGALMGVGGGVLLKK